MDDPGLLSLTLGIYVPVSAPFLILSRIIRRAERRSVATVVTWDHHVEMEAIIRMYLTKHPELGKLDEEAKG